MGKKKKNKGLEGWQVVVIIAFGLLVLLLGLWWWREHTQKEVSNADAERKIRRDLLEHKKIKLQKLIIKKKGLSEQLKNLFEWGYFALRVGLVLLVILFNLIVYRYNLPYCKTENLNQWLGIFLTYTGAAGLIISLVLFIFYKNPASLSTAIGQMKAGLESFVYNKYIEIDGKIEENEMELKNVENELAQLA